MITNESIVTIIIPAYNIESHLERTLQSITSQTLKDFTAIVVDDGSTDNTLRVAEQCASQDPRFKVFRKENGGVSSARNFGLDNVATDYYTFVDGDDIVHSSYLEVLMSHVADEDIDIVTSLYCVGNDEKLLSSTSASEVQIISGADACREMLYDKLIKNHVYAKLFRTVCTGGVRFSEDIAIGEDMEYVARCLDIAKRVAVTEYKLYLYYQREGSAMNAMFSAKRFDSYIAAVRMKDELSQTLKFRQACDVKLFTEAISLASLSYNVRKQYVERYKKCMQSVRELCYGVAFDRYVNHGQRLYALISLINPVLAIQVVRLVRYIKGR